ncbi:sigma-54 interaction domain-containing protein [Longimicrobium sp.]|uniref:sigma-54 interaction domain-containing protein n=1 Tax=Longimicrobium sp. TaxID=2029185 RepID=UPI003B3A0F1B
MLLLDAWREAGRHATIDETTERLAERMGKELPADALLVRRLDPTRLRLETVAVGTCHTDAPAPAISRTELSAAQLEALLAWGRGGAVLRGALEGLLGTVVPGGGRGAALAGPLLDGERMIGVLAATGGAFRASHEGVFAQLLEPFASALRNDLQVHELVRLREALEADNQALLSRLGRQEIADAIVGAQGGLRTVLDRVTQVSGTDVPVLLLGETGTGKEVIAREIHRRSARPSGPVVRVNCGAIPPGLIDSELFGHERGSFTGAVNDRAGWFERADGGTLFLDEIGELPLDAQVRLLRVLQDGTFERVGGRRTHTVDVRIVAATHRDLHTMVQARAFREDLWYRISVFPIHLPPLRERPGDIPALAAHFAWRAGQRLGGAPLVPGPEEMEQLLAYPWPGNVRELAAVIERAVILGGGHRMELAAALGGGNRIEMATLPGASPAPIVASGPAASSAPASGIATLDAAMAEHIRRALGATHGRIEGPGGAAALLGINPHTLRARMRKLGVEWARFRA